jgi:multiple sugar transport system ATP-binding protein
MGSPPMNFLPAKVDANGCLLGESLLGEVSINEFSIREIGCDLPFTLGFRPEDLQPATSDMAHMKGTVELVEVLGSETIVLLR